MLGGALHLLLSIAFAAPLAARPPRRPLVAGAAYGAALYAVNFRLVAPRVWPAVLRHDGPNQMADHIVFGVAAALVSRRTARIDSPSGGG